MMALMMMQNMKMMMTQQSICMTQKTIMPSNGNLCQSEPKANNQLFVDVDSTEETGNSSSTNPGTQNCYTPVIPNMWQSNMPYFMQTQMSTMAANCQTTQQQPPFSFESFKATDDNSLATTSKSLGGQPEPLLPSSDQDRPIPLSAFRLVPTVIDIIDVDSPKKLASPTLFSKPTSTDKSTLPTTAVKSTDKAAMAN